MNEMKSLTQKKWIWPALAFGIPFIASIIICAVIGIYPFGNQCVLHVDMYHQYCPFFVELREKLTTGGSLLYSWNLGLGSDFISLFAYYLSSPLNWLLVICPENLVIEFMTLTIIIKISVAGLCFFLYVKEHFGLVKEDGYRYRSVLPALAFSTAYAFSGYIATYSWNIMWMDAIALTPLIILGLERMIKKNKPGLYYISLTIAIISNFYIAMILCIFLVLYFIILFFEQKKGKGRALFNFGLYSLLAGGSSAALLIPEALVLSRTAADAGSFPEKMEWYCNFLEEISRMSIFAEPFTTGDGHWPGIYCGAFALYFLILYVANPKISLRTKIPRVLLVALLFVSFANNWLDFIWHGFRFPNSLPGRQGFVFIFLVLVLGYEAMRKRKALDNLVIILAAALCVIVLAGSTYVTDPEVTEGWAILLTAVLVMFYSICLMIEKTSVPSTRRGVGLLAVFIALVEIIANMAGTGFYSLSRTSYTAKMDDYSVLLEMAKEDALADAKDGESIFYRVEDYERKTKNDDCLYGYPSGTIFSSLMNIDVSHFYQDVYMEGGKNYYCYNGATPLVSSMLSVRYMLSDNAEGENALRKLIGQSGDYYLYENKYCLSLGFMMTEEAIASWDLESDVRMDKVNQLGQVLGGKGTMLKTGNTRLEIEEGKTTITVLEDGFYYASYKGSNKSDNLSISINGGPITKYNKTSHRFMLELGQCKAGDVITIKDTKKQELDYYVYHLDMDVLNSAYETLTAQEFVVESYSDTEITGHIKVEEAGRLVLTIPAEDGWILKVDGKERSIQDFKDTFISVYLEEGEHTVTLTYMTPGLKLGAVISGFSILVAITLLLTGGKRGKKTH